MLVPILQAVGQYLAPLVPHIVSTMQKIPPYFFLQAGRVVSEKLQSLSPEEKERLKDAAVWMAKDMAGDVAAAAIGLPIGPFVDLAVEKVLDKLGHGENASPAEVTFIRSELLRQLNNS